MASAEKVSPFSIMAPWSFARQSSSPEGKLIGAVVDTGAGTFLRRSNSKGDGPEGGGGDGRAATAVEIAGVGLTGAEAGETVSFPSDASASSIEISFPAWIIFNRPISR